MSSLIMRAGIWALGFGVVQVMLNRRAGMGVAANAANVAAFIVVSFASYILLDLVWNSIWPAIPSYCCGG